MVRFIRSATVALCFLLVFVCCCNAQSYSISGSVTNSKTHQALAGVNVFLNKTTIGVTTGKYGHYELHDLPPGTYNLVFSYVGFKQVTKTVSIPRGYNVPINVQLRPRVVTMDSLIVKDKRPKEWYDKFQEFREHFLGYTRNSDKTVILNPEILRFKNIGGNLIAFSDTPLKIKNNALGYKITMYLREFGMYGTYLRTDATCQFTPLKPQSEEQRQRWNRQRRRAYEGSFRHFIHALTEGDTYDEGFRILYTEHRHIYSQGNAHPKRNLTFFSHSDEAEIKSKNAHTLWNYRKIGQIRLSFQKDYKYLKVVFVKEHPERSLARMMGTNFSMNQVSFIKLPFGDALIDASTALGISVHTPIIYGYWAWSSGIPEWLPKNYTPQPNRSS